MLYHLLYPLADRVAVFNVFRYITFRAAGAIVVSFLVALLLGPWFIAHPAPAVDRPDRSATSARPSTRSRPARRPWAAC